MEKRQLCKFCVHWDTRPELEMPADVGYCDYWERTKKAMDTCQFFLDRRSPEALEYKREMYGAGEEHEDNEEFDA